MNTATALKEIPWKDVNSKFDNNYEQTEEYVCRSAQKHGGDVSRLKKEIESVMEQMQELNLTRLPSKERPP